MKNFENENTGTGAAMINSIEKGDEIKNRYIMKDYLMAVMGGIFSHRATAETESQTSLERVEKFTVPNITDPYQIEQVEKVIIGRDAVHIKYKGGITLEYNDYDEDGDGYNSSITFCKVEKNGKVLLLLAEDNYRKSERTEDLKDFYARMPEGGKFNIDTLEEVFYDLLEGASRDSVEGYTKHSGRKLKFDYRTGEFDVEMGERGSTKFAYEILRDVSRRPGQDLRHWKLYRNEIGFYNESGPKETEALDGLRDTVIENLSEILDKSTFTFAKE